MSFRGGRATRSLFRWALVSALFGVSWMGHIPAWRGGLSGQEANPPAPGGVPAPPPGPPLPGPGGAPAGGAGGGLGAPAPPGPASKPGETPTAGALGETAQRASEEVKQAPGVARGGSTSPLSVFERQVEAYADPLVGRPVLQFGYEVFGRPQPPLTDAPVRGDYVLGTGDNLVISIWGSVDQDHRAVIDREGLVRLPLVGPIALKGLTLDRAEAALKSKFDQQYKNYQLQVRVGGVRDMHVHVVGRVNSPERVRVPSVATLFDALSAAGGVSKDGTLRKIVLRRSGDPPRVIDLYAYLLEGDLQVDVSLVPNDVVLVPPVGPRVALAGRVLRPAIYELNPPEITFDALLAMAGGYARLAYRKSLQIESVSDRGASIRTADLEKTPPSAVRLVDGDVVVVGSASPRLENVVYLAGNVATPGRYAFHEGMRVSDVVNEDTLIEAGFWLRRSVPGTPEPASTLPEPFLEYALIQRLDPHTKQESRIAFNLGKAIFERDPAEDHLLQSQDTIVVFSRSAFESPRTVSITGAVNKPGDFRYFPGMRARDLVRMAGGLLPEAHLASGVLTRIYPEQGGAREAHLPINLAGVMEGDEKSNILLERDDSLAVKVVPEYRKPYHVRIEGEVRQPGIYALILGERLSDLIQRAGGFTEDAYLPVGQFYRESVRRLQQERLDESLQRLETEAKLAAQRYTSAAAAQGEEVDVKAEQARVEKLIAAIRATPAKGRMVIRLRPPEKLAGTPDDIELAEGDRLVIPRRPQEVHVVGAVFNQTALLYQKGLRASDYLQECGGPMDTADMDIAYVIRADGSADSAQSARQGYSFDYSRGRYSRGNLLKSELYPGDTLVVPYDVKPQLSALGLAKTVTQILFQTTVASGVIVAALI